MEYLAEKNFQNQITQLYVFPWHGPPKMPIRTDEDKELKPPSHNDFDHSRARLNE